MSLANRDLLLAAVELPSQEVSVPELGEGVTVRVRSLSGLERGAWDSTTYARGQTVDMSTYKVRLCVFCLVDEKGDRLLQDDDLPAFGKQPAAAIERIFMAAATLNGLLQSNVAAAEKESAATSVSATTGT